jgi:hypothetical protein
MGPATQQTEEQVENGTASQQGQIRNFRQTDCDDQRQKPLNYPAQTNK